MILEEVMSQTRSTNNINIDNIIEEHTQLVLEHNELLSEMADMFVAMLNEECIFTENFFEPRGYELEGEMILVGECDPGFEETVDRGIRNG